VYLFARHGAGWSLQAGPLPAMVGRNGFARPGEKREGDGRTPSGLFPLEFSFGYAPVMTTKMPYRHATDDDLWVDDAHAPDYNQWVRRGQTTASSFEEMKRVDHRYRYGLVIGYNRHPVVAGFGSAIFIHVWLEEGISTSGCVALAEADLVAILAWLDPENKPLILMGDPRHLSLLPGWSGVASTPVRCGRAEP
jgi:L,D-peptidoglycan transpeptidase YkuD (ErfK/YbiS/YcfS/YnhG family)